MSATISLDVLGSPAAARRARHPQRLGIGQEAPRDSARRASPMRLAGRRGATDDLVVDVGDVHDPGHRVAAPAQVADEQVGEQERAEVADVGGTVDGRAARIDTDPVGAQRLERSRLARQRVVEADASSDRLDRGDDERGDRPPGALGAVEIAARGLDADGVAVEPEERGDRVAHRVELGAEPRPGGDDRQVHAGRTPAGGLDPTARPPRPARVLAMPRGVRSSAGKTDPRSPSEVAPSSASATAWRTTSPSEWPASAGAPVDLDAAEVERHPGPERVAVVADARPRPARAGQRRGRSLRDRRAASP